VPATSRYNSRVTATAPPFVDEATPTKTQFSLRQRLLLWLITLMGTVAIRLIGYTLRYEYSIEGEGPPQPGFPEALFNSPVAFGFWHACIFPATYYHRGREIGVLTSRSFDGEYIARTIENFGYRALRGSSTRGVVGGLRSMIRHVREGRVAAFTCDGPQGPAQVAKPGPVLLARQTGAPLCVFHIGLSRCWELKTWDRMKIPRPFAHALVRYSSVIRVPPDATDAQMRQLHDELQTALDRVRDFAESHVC
jgi:lysophospholipid acyltransferase (LPLAT)-like uncharacterized protein